VGNTYEASTGVWSGSPRRSYAFQWQRCDEAGEECTDITGATSPSYTVAEGDLGSTVRMVITASNTLGSASSASAPSEVIIEAPVNILLPTISGTLQEGVELTADPGEWERASGYGYEWQRCNGLGEECADVERYWEASYTPTEEDAEHTLRVIVTAWNGAGEASATSLASAVVTSSGLPRNTELPTISSEAETLSATPGSWHSSGSLSYTYQWERCDEHGEACVGIEGATSLTYPLVEADVEHTLRVAVTATNPFGSATATSEATAVMHATPPPTNAEAPTISGVAQVSQDLTAYPGSWEHASHYAYQWQRCNGHGGGCASIEGATSSTYTLTEAEVEHTIRAAVTATGLGGNETVRTAATAVVTPITPPTNAEAPTIIGVPTAGHTLSAVHGNWSTPHEPLSYVYQWRRCDAAGESCSDIAGATAATYTAGSEDTGGHTLRVVVTATDALGVPGSASSDPRYIAAAVRTTEYSYDANGNLETRTDGNGHSTSYEYGPANEQTKVTQADGSTTETGYDGDGLVTSQTDGNGHMTKYRRNVLGQVSEVTDPLGRKTSKEYDLAGNLTSVTDPAERTTTYRYDPANRLIEKTYSDGTTPNVEYEYDADGNKLKVIDGTGTSTYHYDELDRLSEATDGHGDSTGYEYDLAGDQTKLTYQSGESVERKFDEDGRLAGIKDWLGNETSFAYDPDSNLTSTTFPEATSETDRYAYNLADQITETSFGKSSETLASVTYGRDGEGQVASTSSTELPGEASSSYTYNQANRLTKDGATAYEYDPAGSPTKLGSSAAAYDEASQPEHAGGTDFSYDAVGERTKATPSAGPSTSYGYDQAGELASVSRLSEGEAPAIEDSYAYSGDGLRTSQTSGGTTKYLSWDQSAGLPLILGDGNDSFIYGPADTPIEQIDNTTGTVTYLHHDQAGSTRLLTGSTGTVSGKCAYSAYGTPTCEGSSTPLGFDGEYTSADTGLIYMRARTYDPSTAQFLSLDPLEKLTRAPYDFAEDNPLNESDPTGLGDWLGLGIPSPGEVLFPGGGSGQACLGGTISYGGISVGLEACYVHTPHGEGVAITPSVTAGPGIGVNVHAGAGESNACRPSEYGGLFSQVGGSAELGTGVYYGRFSSFPYNELSGSRSVEGWTAGGSVGIGAEAGVGGSYTFTIPIGGESGGSGSSGCGC
jgi:RHS repeat-associated protein